MKIMSVFGTRPEIIRLSLVFRDIERKGFEHVMVNTNQNYSKNLNSIFFEELGVREADYNLNVSTESFGKEVSEIIQRTEDIILKEKPDILLVLGDTNSGLSAIPAAHHGVKIAHMEAGMRSYDWRMPEEKNRVTIDHLSNILFPYTEYCRQNLIRENIAVNKIYVTGNPIVDVIQHFDKTIEKSRAMEELGVEEGKYFLVTAHRKENVDDRKELSKIFRGLGMVSEKYGMKMLYPMHPRTRSKMSGIKVPDNVKLIEPIGFFDFVKLEKNAFCILTDSGTVQEECCYFKKPCVTVRMSTERPETVEIGSNIVSGLDPGNITASVDAALKTRPEWDYNLGDGRTAARVVNILRGVF